MSERGPRGGGFESGSSYRRGPETERERFLHGLGESVRRVRWETPELREVDREFLRKIDEKIQLKENIDSMQRYRNDITVRQPLKQLGIFLIKETETRIDYEDPTTGLRIRPGDRIIDLHMPPVKNPEDKTLSAVTASLEMIAKYINYHHLDPKYILGVTYERLANVSRRQGFTVAEAQIPESLRAGVENVHSRFTEEGRNGQSIGKILLCYQTGDQFMSRYLQEKPVVKK